MAYAGASSNPPPQYYPLQANPIAVVNPQLCAPYPVDLIICKKLMTLKEGSFAVTDVNGNVMFKIKGSVFSIHDRRVLLDASDHPIISFQQKVTLLFNFPILPFDFFFMTSSKFIASLCSVLPLFCGCFVVISCALLEFY